MPQKNVFGKPADCSRVLLHACCAPCSSAIVEWLLDNGVQPVIYYYNPNIWPRQEYEIRKQESKRHADSLGISWIDGDYDHDAWLDGVSKCEWRVASSDNSPEEQNYDVATEPERGRRCQQCFYLRLLATARKARELGIRYFATTLASSRWKSLDQVNRAGEAAAAMVSNEAAGMVNGVQPVTFWAQNWRKGGLQERRNELLRTFGFYNQQYCGCEFSASRLPTKELLRHQMRELKRQHAARLADYSAAIANRLQALLLSRVPSVASEQNSSAPPLSTLQPSLQAKTPSLPTGPCPTSPTCRRSFATNVNCFCLWWLAMIWCCGAMRTTTVCRRVPSTSSNPQAKISPFADIPRLTLCLCQEWLSTAKAIAWGAAEAITTVCCPVCHRLPSLVCASPSRWWKAYPARHTT
jgi:predicted adenine nucleotide alpha hydrolase (AANH) superfamily ATPase